MSADSARVAVGVYVDDSYAGSAYVLDGATAGEQLLKPAAADRGFSGRSGIPVAVSADGARVTLGAYGGDSGAVSAYVPDVSSTGEQWLKPEPAERQEGDFFGWSVAVSADGARVAGSSRNDSRHGFVYVFERTTGEQLLKLVAADGEAFDFFGYLVAVSADSARAAAGAYGDGSYASSAAAPRLAAPRFQRHE